MNWEWVVDCATRANANVVIVSRDSDYGVNLKGDGYINTWLAQEFKERVSKRRNVTLTDRLSEGLKQISIRVTKREAKAEEEFLQHQSSQLKDIFGSAGLSTAGFLSPYSPLSNLSAGGVVSPFSQVLGASLGSPQKDLSKHSPAAPPDDEEDND